MLRHRSLMNARIRSALAILAALTFITVGCSSDADTGETAGGEHLADDGASAEPADGPEPVGSDQLAPPPPADEPTSNTAGEELYDVGFSNGVSDFHAGNPWDPVSDDPDPSVSHYYDGYEDGWEEAAYE